MVLRSSTPRPRFVRGAALADPAHIARPVTLEDIQREVLRCAEDGERLRVAGGGTAANSLWSTDENLLTLDHFTGIESADLERARVWVRAGTTLGVLAEWLRERGLALPVDGWSAAATVGGAVSVGAHGSGSKLSNLSAHVTAIGLVDRKSVV
jgi:FAD/FMN-containing dehydrogenase